MTPASRPEISDQVLARRLTAQLLAGTPARDPVTATRRLLAVQGQDPRGARLALRARTRHVSAADVNRALTEERSLLITWCNRGTLHLVASEDYPWLHALTTPPLRSSSERRLAQEGVDAHAAARGVAIVDRALADEGPLTRGQLGEHLQRNGVPTAGQALVHLLFAATLDGICVRGPMRGREQAYVRVEDWLGASPPVDRDLAQAELARRYLAGHGPAKDRDLARWAGLPLRDARAGLTAIAGELRELGGGLVELAGSGRAARLPAPRLLGAFEPVLMGWCSREAILGPHADAVVTGGSFRGFAMAGGRAVGLWRLAGRAVTLEPFGKLATGDAEALDADGQALVAFLAR